ncbi:cysteinyl-tRNA synthetase [Microbotryomycetes sp. JL201]|nr:cysteinyl-tRNA synthetase [Microbotryomycetes sp. JL201]
MATAPASSSASAVQQQPWSVPQPQQPAPTLKVYNSLTRSKVDFVTKKPGVVTWYNCGPTVYDASHMGHARPVPRDSLGTGPTRPDSHSKHRNYMAQDIMRRILRDYFGYEVHFVMNITDVDDKIILRARQKHLLEQYVRDKTSLTQQLVDDAKMAWSAYVHKNMSAALAHQSDDTSSYSAAKLAWNEITASARDSAWLDAQKAREEKFSMHMAAIEAGDKGIQQAEADLAGNKTSREAASALVDATKDALSIWLDKQFGNTVTDPAIFRDLAAYWEQSYFDSMTALHVEKPDVLTRVSEYIPEIVEFVQGIVNRGLAYEAAGSVWFDTAKFEGADGDGDWKHTYAKLQPWSKGNRELLEDGEGSLTSSTGKRNSADFALWKASKPGEPAWPSPWGAGRPGWHIECSVMASAVLGDGMDVHSGGVDLAFPHHDNEIAQSEAYHNCRQWVNYFLHTGHLHIEGLKMSKSLKNFITIDDALTRNSARQLRFAFLLASWNARLDFKETLMQEVKAGESLLNNFFAVINALLEEAKANAVASDGRHHYDQEEKQLLVKLEQAQVAFRHAMCDSFDTPTGMQVILDLVSTTNVYLSRGRSQINTWIVQTVADWVTRMLRMFGLGEGSPVDSKGNRVIGWGVAAAPGQSSEDRQEILMPVLRAVSGFRDAVRKLAIEGGSNADILALSDKFRDEDAVELGIALDDQKDGRALFKLVPTEILREARDAKLQAQREQAERKAASAAAAAAKRRERLEKGRLSPRDMFRQSEDFSAWDDNGVPTLDKDGNELPKSRRKKLQKEWDIQDKLHQEFLKEQESVA